MRIALEIRSKATSKITPKSNASNDMAVEIWELDWPIWNSATCRFMRPSNEATVYSPSTTAMEMNEADRIDCHRFGMITRKNTRGHEAPSEREASHSVFTSMEFSPTAIARKANGITRIT